MWRDAESPPCFVSARKLTQARDVWRRHLTRCARNVDNDEAPLSKRGQKPRACDYCFQRKTACDNKQPCSRCSSSDLLCSYDRLDSFGAVSEPASAIIQGVDSQSRNAEPKMALPFLLNMTDPNANSMVDSLQVLDNHNLDMTDPTPEPAAQPPADHDIYPPSIFPDNLNLSLFLDDRFSPWLLSHPSDDHCPEQWTDTTPSTPPTPPDEPILAEIITTLHILHTTLVTDDPSYNETFSLPLAHQVFTPANRALFVGRYFRSTHREFPLTHRPSFDLATVSPGLLLAFFLCGSMHSTSGPVLETRAFLRVAEEYVFRRLGEVMALGKEVEGREVEEALQAALLVHCTQFALQGVETRERNRVVRLPALVGAVRRLGLLGVRHGEGEGGWRGFVEREVKLRFVLFLLLSGGNALLELIMWLMRNRIGAWTLLADWQQCGMFRVPPLMAISELTGVFPCVPSLWEAECEIEFNTIVAAKGPSVQKRSCSIRQAMEALMADATWSGIEQFPLRDPTVHDLHFLIYAIHAVVGSASLMGLLPVSGAALLRATERWEQLWRQATSLLADSGEDVRHMAGTMSHYLSPEMCWLAKKLVEGGMNGCLEGLEYYQGAHYSLDPLHALIKRLKDL